MKVKDLIEQLQQLDGDREAHLIYDMYADLEIEIEPVLETDTYPNSVKSGDYVICAG